MRKPVTAAPVTEPRLELKDIVVQFGATRALDGVSVSIGPGEIVGLLGPNGAGKSTLLKVATGALRATSGEYVIDGEPVPERATPAQIAARGATIVHQEPALVGNMTVFENLYLARRAPRDRAARRARAREALDLVDALVPLDIPVDQLSLGERQLVDLARGTLAGTVKIMFLDEPTAALGDLETRALHDLIRRFSSRGTAVVYVSHRLPDILDVCQRVVVLRAGAVVLDRLTAGLSTPDLVQALAPGTIRREVVGTGLGLEVAVIPYGDGLLRARAGEVVGLYGMAAGDQFTLLESMFGMRGSVESWLKGELFSPRSPVEAMLKGVHLVPGDREVDGLIPGASARDNVLLPWWSRFGGGAWVDSTTGAEVYRSSRKALRVHGPVGEEPIAAFSSGNRQKHLVARWMFVQQPDLLLLAQPTQGVDVGAKADIALAVRELASRGVTVIVASSDTDEISLMCDRAYVLLGGRSTELTPSADFDVDLLDALFALGSIATETGATPARPLSESSQRNG